MSIRDSKKWITVVTVVIIIAGVLGTLYYLLNGKAPVQQDSEASNTTFAKSKTPTIKLLSTIESTKMYFNDDRGVMDAEITPWTLETKKLGGDYLYLVTSYNTHLCSTPDNILTLTSLKKIPSCKLRQSSQVTPSTNGTVSTATPWRRDYYGAFSGHILSENNGKNWYLYTINHGELLNNNYFASQPCRQAPNLGYGNYPCTNNPTTRHLSYNAFIGMSKFSWDLATYNSDKKFVDLGPIVWPANGYVSQGKKGTELGLLHPTSIIDGKYIYVYYIDGSKGSESKGRGSGIKVARAPITTKGIDYTKFKTFYKDGFRDYSLPTGFKKEQISNFYKKPGGRATSILTETYSFSVARIKGTKAYLGISYDLRRGVTLRFSKDLVHWSEPTVVPGTESNYIQGGVDLTTVPLLYPRLASADGDSNNEIDPSNFYITGTTTGKNPFNPTQNAKIVNKLRLRLTSLPY